VPNPAYVVLSLNNNADLTAIQQQLLGSSTIDGIEPQSPDTFHVTLLACDDIDDAALQDIAGSLQLPPVDITAKSVGVFHNDESSALHLPVENTPELSALQAKCHQLFAAKGIPVSEYSRPEHYKPHITLAYLPKGQAWPDASVEFSAPANSLTVARKDASPMATITPIEPAAFAEKDADRIPPNVGNPDLYRKIRQAVQREYPDRWPSPFASGVMYERYTAAGGKFGAKKSLSNSGDDQAIWTQTYETVLAQTKDEVRAEQAATGAAARHYLMPMMKSVAGGVQIEGWAILFSNAQNKDLQGTYFNEMTRLFLDYYPNAPLWYEHGLDPAYLWRPIGKRINAEVTPHGVYLTHILYADDPQYERTVQEAERGELVYSTDSIPQYVRAGFKPSDSRYGAWPLAGCTLTKQPAEPGLGPVALKDFELAVKGMAMVRDAQPGPADASRQQDDINNMESGDSMNKIEMMNKLAAALGCEPTPEAIAAAFEQVMGNDNVDPAMATAMGTDPSNVKSMLQGLYDMISETEEEVVEEVPTRNYGAFAELVAAAKSQPVGVKVPAMVRDGDAKKSTRYGTTNYNKAEKPLLAGLILGILERRSDSAMKSMGYVSGPAGGWMLNRQESTELIELFYANTVLKEAGADIVDMAGIETPDVSQDVDRSYCYLGR
jgi:2'-5' RNA ligase